MCACACEGQSMCSCLSVCEYGCACVCCVHVHMCARVRELHVCTCMWPHLRIAPRDGHNTHQHKTHEDEERKQKPECVHASVRVCVRARIRACERACVSSALACGAAGLLPLEQRLLQHTHAMCAPACMLAYSCRMLCICTLTCAKMHAWMGAWRFFICLCWIE